MKAIANLVVKIANLLEAEGRAAIRGTIQLTVSLLLLLIAATLLFGGILVLCIAMFMGLLAAMHPALATLLVGLVLLVAGFVIGAFAYLYSLSRSK